MSWFPYHSVDDLLWCSSRARVASGKVGKNQRLAIPAATNKATRVTQEGESTAGALGSAISGAGTKEGKAQNKAKSQKKDKIAFLRFNPDRLFCLICRLDDVQEMAVEDVARVSGIRSASGIDEYRRFLMSAGLVHVQGRMWKAQSELSALSAALRNERVEESHDKLLAAPSYQLFVERIEELEIGQTLKREQFGRGITTYRTLGEVLLICAEVRGEGIYPTPNDPNVTEFARIAQERFEGLQDGGGLVAVGTWLEALIRKDGIHPIVARRRLGQASEHGFIRRTTEGSTTQIRNDDHVLHVLRADSEAPRIEKVHLYRGDFLIPGKASVSLRIRGA